MRPLFDKRELSDGSLEAALNCASRGWAVTPWAARGRHKFPLTPHGHLDATIDPVLIAEWWGRLPEALVSIATGKPSDIVALDIDLRPTGSGFDTLEMLGVSQHPETPTSHTPAGGCHLLFKRPGHHVKTIAGALGPYLDIRGDGGSLIVPPGPGRFWDPDLGPDTPLAAMPEWMVLPQPARAEVGERPILRQPLSHYAETALDRAINNIIKAPNGQQRDTLNRESYAIGRLVAGGALPSPLALEALRWAADQLISYDQRRPWRQPGKLVERAFLDGLRNPRRPGIRR